MTISVNNTLLWHAVYIAVILLVLVYLAKRFPRIRGRGQIVMIVVIALLGLFRVIPVHDIAGGIILVVLATPVMDILVNS